MSVLLLDFICSLSGSLDHLLNLNAENLVIHGRFSSFVIPSSLCR